MMFKTQNVHVSLHGDINLPYSVADVKRVRRYDPTNGSGSHWEASEFRTGEETRGVFVFFCPAMLISLWDDEISSQVAEEWINRRMIGSDHAKCVVNQRE